MTGPIECSTHARDNSKVDVDMKNLTLKRGGGDENFSSSNATRGEDVSPLIQEDQTPSIKVGDKPHNRMFQRLRRFFRTVSNVVKRLVCNDELSVDVISSYSTNVTSISGDNSIWIMERSSNGDRLMNPIDGTHSNISTELFESDRLLDSSAPVASCVDVEDSSELPSAADFFNNISSEIDLISPTRSITSAPSLVEPPFDIDTTGTAGQSQLLPFQPSPFHSQISKEQFQKSASAPTTSTITTLPVPMVTTIHSCEDDISCDSISSTSQVRSQRVLLYADWFQCR